MKKVQTTSVSTARTRTSQSYVMAEKIAVVATLRESLHLGDNLLPAERTKARDTTRNTPDALIEGVAAIAAEHGGQILGLTFPSDLARETVAYAAAVAPLINALRDLALQLENDTLRRREPIAKQALAAYNVIRSVKDTPQGRALLNQYSMLRATRRASRPRRVATAISAAPSVAVVALPSASASAHVA